MRVEGGFLRIGRVNVHSLHILGMFAPLIVWEGAAHYLVATNRFADSLFPSIERVFGHDLPGFAAFGQQLGGTVSIIPPGYGPALTILAQQSLATISRLLLGTSAGIVLGIIIGIVMSLSDKVYDLLDLPLEVLRMIPAFALLPLFLLWFGGREEGTFIYITFAIFVVIVISTLVAIKNLSPIYRDYARTLGASKFQVYRTVIIPGIVPGLTGAIRVALGSAWAIVVAAEYLAAPSGLGRLMVLSEMFFFTGRMVVIVLLFMIYSAILNGVFLALARRVTRWQP